MYPYHYIIGYTTVKMLQRLMANIDIFGSTRKCFQSREAFNVHFTTKHHEQDPFPDQLKVAHFVLQRKFLAPDVTRDKVEKFGDPKKACVSISNIDCYEARKKKVMDNFERKKFLLFGIISERSNGTDDDESDSDEL